jgi:hypothetical protein
MCYVWVLSESSQCLVFLLPSLIASRQPFPHQCPSNRLVRYGIKRSPLTPCDAAGDEQLPAGQAEDHAGQLILPGTCANDSNQRLAKPEP